jgi:hypothetical protein
VILLITKSLPTVQRFDSGVVGRLFTPRHVNSVAATAAAGIPWAADNDAFSGFDEGRFLAMLERIKGHDGCLFVTAPDVVGDPDETWRLFSTWCGVIGDTFGLPLGFVTQDGATTHDVPWSALDALFIGGTDAWKLSEGSEWLAREAKDRGKWVHMGRVNSVRRIRRAQDWGCDSVDGTNWVRWTDRWMPRGIAALTYEQPELA